MTSKTNAAPAPAAAKIAPVVSGTAAIPMPERKTNRGSKSLYPFETLTTTGMAFGLKNKTAKDVSSAISNQNRKWKVESVNPTTGEKTVEQQRHFFAHDVDAEYAKTLKGTPLEGSTVLVFRDK